MAELVAMIGTLSAKEHWLTDLSDNNFDNTKIGKESQCKQLNIY